jgi:exosortase/archaeosortase family protein
VLMDIARGPTDAVRFVLRAVAGSLGLFGLLRLTWIEAHVVLPCTRMQGGLALDLFGTPAAPVEATLACSGADALALCVGAVLAYPVSWRSRLAGAAGGVVLILALNTLRIGTLGQVASSPAWFDTLHLYVWPAVLTLAIAGYVFAWMRLADGRHARDEHAAAPREPALSGPLRPSRRFVILTVAFLLLFSAASPLYLESPRILALAAVIAHAAAGILVLAGVSAHAAANELWTPRGGVLVTQECISTPLIPLYLAAICAYSTTWRSLIAGVLATTPLFVALGIVRLLVVALPDVVTAPIVFVHVFYQLLLGAVVVFLAALWRHGGKAALGHAMLGMLAGVLFLYLLGPFYTRVITDHAGVMLDDPQGAIAFLPAFQVSLYLALWIAAFAPHGSKPFLIGLAVLGLTQMTGLLALHVLATQGGLTAHVRDIRGWAVMGPLLIFAAVVNLAEPRR